MTYKFGLQIVLCKFGITNSVLQILFSRVLYPVFHSSWCLGTGDSCPVFHVQTRGNSFDRSFISQLIHQLIRQIENSNPSDTGNIDGILFRADWLYNCFIVRYFWCRVVRHVLGMTFCSLTETGVTKIQTPKTQSPRN